PPSARGGPCRSPDSTWPALTERRSGGPRGAAARQGRREPLRSGRARPDAGMSEDEALFAAAEKARRMAYAPYSGFSVGAAILSDDEVIEGGCNVEYAAFPRGSCAEASAIAAMIAGGGRRILKVYITGPGEAPVTPCGGCRQRIREFAADDATIISHGIDG